MDIKAVNPKKQEALAQYPDLKLFIAGEDRPVSVRAVARFREILQSYDIPASSGQIIDIEKSPQLAKEAQVIGTPALVKEHPLPRKSVIGDLSNAVVVLRALGLSDARKQYAASLAEVPQESLILREAGRSKLKTVRVLMVDFSPVVREGLQSILAMDYGIELNPYASDVDQALLHLKQAFDHGRPVNVVLTEFGDGTVDGIQMTRLIKHEFPEVAVLVLTKDPDDSYVMDAIQAGAAGYMFLKDLSPEILIRGIYRVAEGGTQITQAMLHTAVVNLIQNGRDLLAKRTAEAAHLTEREVDVLRLLGNGDSNNIISETLGITIDTTKKHVQNVIYKLQARSRTHAAIIASQAGIVGKPVTPVLKALSEPGSIA